MDLTEWITSDHLSLRTKLFRSVIDIVPRERWSETVDGGGSSIGYVLVHLARHHDLALNVAIRGHAPAFLQHAPLLGVAAQHPAAGLTEREDRQLASALDAEALVDYVTDVFDAAERWFQHMSAAALDVVPDSSARLTQLAHVGRDEAGWLHEMWAGKAVWWLIQWPIIGHGHAHVGELISLRNRLGLSPF